MDKLDLKDIKPLVDIPDKSIYIFIALVVVGVLLFGVVVYAIYRFIKSKKEKNIRKENLKKLKAVDLKLSKKSAYEITKFAYYFAQTNEKHYKKAMHLISLLSKYKYKKTVSAFDKEVISNYHLFVELVSHE